jgi:hypothetical protein
MTMMGTYDMPDRAESRTYTYHSCPNPEPRSASFVDIVYKVPLHRKLAYVMMVCESSLSFLQPVLANSVADTKFTGTVNGTREIRTCII